MNTNIEKEYKVMLNKDQFNKLTSKYNGLVFKKQINTYYDNAQMDIQNIHGAMRIREISNSYLFTMKLLKADDLYEFECVVDRNDNSVFDEPEIKKLLDEYHIIGPFQQITSLTTFRAMLCNELAEICFDENHYNGIVDYEIEYEYKCDHDGLSIFQKILNPIGITYKENCPSKIKRAFDSIKQR